MGLRCQLSRQRSLTLPVSLKVRSEIQHQQHEVAELHLLEKKREREKARGEVDEDIQCRTKMGE